MDKLDMKIIGAVLALVFFVMLLGALQSSVPVPDRKGEAETFKLVPTKDPSELEALEEPLGGVYTTSGALVMGALSKSAETIMGAGEQQKVTLKVSPDRISATNVQVEGIDEPDILKIDDGYAFFHSYNRIKVIDAFPPEEAEVVSKIDADWLTKMLKVENVLIALEGTKIRGYDVSDPANPEEAWTVDPTGVVKNAREKDGKIYVIVSDSRITCPYTVTNGITVPCSRYYHPNIPVGTDTTYTIMKIDGKTGRVENAISLTGSYQTTVYVSENAIYFAYRIQKSFYEVLYDFLLEEGDEILPKSVVDHLRKVDSYDISKNAKIAEMQKALEEYFESLTAEEMSNVSSKMQKVLEDYIKRNADKIDRTGIAKIGLEDLEIEATGEVPGHLLNQWAMDEYEGHLRVATTTTVGWRDHVGNNLYVLDGKLNIVGKIEGLEEGERIYAVRFTGDKAYVVTFKETDPFIVLDLSDPENPRVEGILKIPGFSTYLHPIGDHHIVGVGRGDNWNIKVSLFDVSDPENPVEKDVYYLDEGWGAVLFDHHAFLWDAKHSLLLLPAGNKYYILRVRTDEKPYIEAVKIVNFDGGAQRAAYMDDYAYLFSYDEMVVVDENTGEEIKRLRIDQYIYYPMPIAEPVETEETGGS